VLREPELRVVPPRERVLRALAREPLLRALVREPELRAVDPREVDRDLLVEVERLVERERVPARLVLRRRRVVVAR
jgi:hypothetical protein